MQSSNSVEIFTILAKMNSGKTTLGKYLMELLNKPSIIVDIAKQFEENTPYRKIVRGIRELKWYLGNPYHRKAFYKAKLQLIYRFTSEEEQEEAKELFNYLNRNISDITIFCEEMELYADQYIKKSNPIFRSLYLARNNKFDVIVIAKNIGQLSPLVKDATTVFFSNTRSENGMKYLDGRSENKFSKEVKHLNQKEFLIIYDDEIHSKFKLKKQIIKLIK